ncbi:MAG: response regulator [Planctomycetes bacterium]|nr:response regulator [Planctomycetota bacterium]
MLHLKQAVLAALGRFPAELEAVLAGLSVRSTLPGSPDVWAGRGSCGALSGECPIEVPDAVRRRLQEPGSRVVAIPATSLPGLSPRHPCRATQAGPCAYLGLPLVSAGRVFGALHVLLPEAHASRPELVRRATEWADTLAAPLLDADQADARQHRADALLRLAQRSSDIVFRCRLRPAFAVEYISPAVTPLLGYIPDELYADAELFRRLFHPEDQPRLAGLLTSAQDAEQACTVRWCRKNGEYLWIEQRITAILDAAGAYVEFEGIARDVTARVRAEAALRDSHRRLEETLANLRALEQQVARQERLRALGQLSSGIAHDFNNLLSPILGFTEILQCNPELLADSKRVAEYLERIHSAAVGATAVVARMREFYRERAVDEPLRPVDLNQTVTDALALTQPRWRDQALAQGRSIRIEHDLAPDLPQLGGDAAALRDAWINLLLNAVDALPTGGTITLRTCTPAPDKVRIEVEDDGAGMTEDVRQRCVEPFFTTKGVKGSGLGLAMVYGIVERHGGALEIASTPGQGTRMTVEFPVRAAVPAAVDAAPAAPAAATPGAEADPASGARAGRPLRVLVVEDEPQLRQLLQEFLALEGHEAVCAGEGVEGLARLGAEGFDAVFTDRAMPGMAGDQFAREVKLRAPRTPVVMITGYGVLMQAAGELPAGVDRLLSKPITRAALRAALAAAMGGEKGDER